MPPAILNAYSADIPRLQAEESMLWAERFAVGGGRLRKGVGSRIMSRWERLADHRRPVIRPRSASEHKAQMASMGIAVKGPKVSRDG